MPYKRNIWLVVAIKYDIDSLFKQERIDCVQIELVSTAKKKIPRLFQALSMLVSLSMIILLITLPPCLWMTTQQ